MTRQPQLETSLRALKLSGMLDTLEARLAQASAGQLGHLEFLQVLCEDEINRRDAAAVARRLRGARFETPTTLEDFDFTANPKLPAAAIRDLATLRFLDRSESVILYGPVGVGKTHLAQALGHLACRRGHSVLFTKTSRLLADLAGGHADRSWAARLRRYAAPTLLICDLPRPRDYPDMSSDGHENPFGDGITGRRWPWGRHNSAAATAQPQPSFTGARRSDGRRNDETGCVDTG